MHCCFNAYVYVSLPVNLHAPHHLQANCIQANVNKILN